MKFTFGVRAALMAAVLAALSAGSAQGQTRLDLETQSQNINFSGAISTRPVKTGSVLPGTCATGELFFNTAAPAGSNLFLCGSTDTWSQVSTSGGGSEASAVATTTIGTLPATCTEAELLYVTDASFGTGGWRLYQCTATNTWNQMGVQADGSGYLTVTCATPGTCLVGPNTAVVPSLNGPNTWTGAGDFSGASKSAMFRLASSDPGTCDATTREMYFNTTTDELKVCVSTDTWTVLATAQ